MQLRAQWWLVITRPWDDTSEAEQPPAMRTEAMRTWSSHAWSGVNP